jgi:hypothetical protein
MHVRTLWDTHLVDTEPVVAAAAVVVVTESVDNGLVVAAVVPGLVLPELPPELVLPELPPEVLPETMVTSTQFWNSSPQAQRLQLSPGQVPSKAEPQSEAVYPAAVS